MARPQGWAIFVSRPFASTVEIARTEALEVERHVAIALRADRLHHRSALRNDCVEVGERYFYSRRIAVVADA